MDTSYVAVAVVTSRTEAELIAGLLRSNGLEAAVSADDAGGQDPQLQILGRRAGGVHVAEQVQRQQPARPGPVVDPPVPAHLEAALDVPAGIPGIGLAGEPHRNRSAHATPAPPPAFADELVERLPQDRLAASGGERLALRAGDAHDGFPPGGRVVAPHAVLAERGPDLVLAQSQHVSGHRAADGDAPVRGERVDLGLAEHAVRVPWRRM